MGTRSTEEIALEVRGVSKSFPGQVALDAVDISIQCGEIHSLVGQNGSGKSTLIKLLSGYHQPDYPTKATVRGSEFQLGDGTAARRHGITFVHQDLALIDSLSALENMAIGTGYQARRFGRIRWGSERRRVAQTFDRLHLEIDPGELVGNLSAAERTSLAVARAISAPDHTNSTRANLVVLDEPTATLAADEAVRLFVLLKRLRDDGVAILFVSHHLDEVVGQTDRVSVFRDGQRVATTNAAAVDQRRLAELMVGGALEPRNKVRTVNDAAPVRLELKAVAGGPLLPLDLDVREGEIVGIAGLDGSGRESIVGMLCGRISREGKVLVGGAEIPSGDPRRALKGGLGFIPNDRSRNGLVPTMTLEENVTLGDVSNHVNHRWLSKRSERREASRWIRDLAIKASGPTAPIGTLSGGNQQKVLLARTIRSDPSALLLDEPTQGVDVGGKLEIHRLVEDAAQAGTAVLVASTDSEELANLCDRILVLYRGRIVSVLDRSAIVISTEAINHAQLGVVA
jgi:ribose transport system ATP-binding protein